MAFDEDSERRIAKVVRTAERHADALAQRDSLRLAQPGKVFIVTTQISAMSGNRPGKGRGTMQILNLDTGLFTASDQSADIYNVTTARIVVNAYVKCGVVDGAFFYDTTSCANGI